MNVGEWSAWLAQIDEAAVYFVDAPERAAVFQAAQALDYAAIRLDLDDCRDEAGLFARFAAVFRFPDWFGDNWDALADCLGDLSWWPVRGYVLVLNNTAPLRDASPDAWQQLLDLLSDTADSWRATAIPFWTLVTESPDPSL